VAYREPARTTRRVRIRWIRVAALLAVGAASAAALGHELPASSSATTAGPTEVPRVDRAGLRVERRPRSEPPRPLSEADGLVPDGVTVFADGYPAVARLDPALLNALRRAATDAAGEGVEVYVDSGWRSPAYQAQLLEEAISKYGSREEAARWVASPDTSAHVSGDAVDVGRSDAAAWLSRHGAEYGLCQIYGNEPWHYELRPAAIRHGCPPTYADPTDDPRMRQ
jgi:hypothetical protein